MFVGGTRVWSAHQWIVISCKARAGACWSTHVFWLLLNNKWMGQRETLWHLTEKPVQLLAAYNPGLLFKTTASCWRGLGCYAGGVFKRQNAAKFIQPFGSDQTKVLIKRRSSLSCVLCTTVQTTWALSCATCVRIVTAASFTLAFVWPKGEMKSGSLAPARKTRTHAWGDERQAALCNKEPRLSEPPHAQTRSLRAGCGPETRRAVVKRSASSPHLAS